MPENKRKAAPATTAPPLSKKTKKTKKTPTAVATPATSISRTPHRPGRRSRGSDNEDGVGIVVTKTVTSNREAETVISGRKTAPLKRAADFFAANESEEEEESGAGWDELHAKEAKATKGKKTSGSKKVSDKKAAGKIVKKTKLDAGAAEEESGGVKISAMTQMPTKPKPKKLAHSPNDKVSLFKEDVGGVLIGSGQNSESSSEDEYDEGDDQTTTLLRGFESSDEEEDSSIAPIKKRDFRNLTVPGIKQKIASRVTDSEYTPGYVFLGRIPHGFYEYEMRSYFSQFGDLLRLRLSRSKKTGRSKHYAFLEFASSEVAEIVAETMDNYLIYGHILKCKVIPRSEIKDVEALFKGAGKRFKRIPWTDIMRRQLEKKRTVAEWAKLEGREETRRKKRNRKLKELGFDYQYDQEMLAVPVVEEAAAEVVTDREVKEKEISKAVPTPVTAKEGKAKDRKSNMGKVEKASEEEGKKEKKEEGKKRKMKELQKKAEKVGGDGEEEEKEDRKERKQTKDEGEEKGKVEDKGTEKIRKKKRAELSTAVIENPELGRKKRMKAGK